MQDRIAPGVRALFVGINPGVRSALTGHHFAGHSNRFWKLLHESGLVPERITHEDDVRLPEWGYGITNLVPRASPGIGDLAPAEYQAGREELERKIARFRPEIVALVGVTLYRVLFRTRGRPRRDDTESDVPNGVIGLRAETLAGVPVFVLPNPSGRNASFSHAEMLDAFRSLKRHLARRLKNP